MASKKCLPAGKCIALLLILALSLAACATTGESTTGRWTGTALGAVTGALIGKEKGGTKGALAGALIGGAVGYGVGWLVDEYITKRTKTASQVRAEYAGNEGDKGPKAPQVHNYALLVDPRETLGRGEGAQAVSSFDLNARQGTSLKVEEERAIVTPDGTVLAKKRRVCKDVDGAGGYEFRQPVSIPKEADQGRYVFESTLFVNGAEAGRAKAPIMVARGRGTTVLVRR